MVKQALFVRMYQVASTGLILLDRRGNVGIAHNSPNIAFGWMHEGMNEPVVGVKREENSLW